MTWRPLRQLREGLEAVEDLGVDDLVAARQALEAALDQVDARLRAAGGAQLEQLTAAAAQAAGGPSPAPAFTSSRQDGNFLAQVFGPSGDAVATLEPSEDPAEASGLAAVFAAAGTLAGYAAARATQLRETEEDASSSPDGRQAAAQAAGGGLQLEGLGAGAGPQLAAAGPQLEDLDGLAEQLAAEGRLAAAAGLEAEGLARYAAARAPQLRETEEDASSSPDGRQAAAQAAGDGPQLEDLFEVDESNRIVQLAPDVPAVMIPPGRYTLEQLRATVEAALAGVRLEVEP